MRRSQGLKDRCGEQQVSRSSRWLHYEPRVHSSAASLSFVASAHSVQAARDAGPTLGGACRSDSALQTCPACFGKLAFRGREVEVTMTGITALDADLEAGPLCLRAVQAALGTSQPSEDAGGRVASTAELFAPDRFPSPPVIWAESEATFEGESRLKGVVLRPRGSQGSGAKPSPESTSPSGKRRISQCGSEGERRWNSGEQCVHCRIHVSSHTLSKLKDLCVLVSTVCFGF
ncbi:hypothetical protein CB1_000849045 [Camelus ferus]|nr:hypothetical protein CB1_000849045 [Camelus ferus]